MADLNKPIVENERPRRKGRGSESGRYGSSVQRHNSIEKTVNANRRQVFNPETPFIIGGFAENFLTSNKLELAHNGIPKAPFKGCIRNIRINNQVRNI